MRFASTVPAQQLKSVAHRYQFQSDTDRRHKASPNNLGSSLAPVNFQYQHGHKHPSSQPTNQQESQDKLSRLEAILFLAREPLTTRKLAQFADLADGTEARSLIARLNRQYDARRCAFRAERIAGGYQLLSRPQFAEWLRRFSHASSEMRLSAPAMETLAVVAYRQPVLRAEVEAIRGVNCGEILRQLMDRDLVRIGGRSHELGRPYFYSTTRRFLQLFGLNYLEDLPRKKLFEANSSSTHRTTSEDFDPSN